MDSTIPVTIHFAPETHATLMRAASEMGFLLSDYLIRVLELTARDHVKIEQICEGLDAVDERGE